MWIAARCSQAAVQSGRLVGLEAAASLDPDVAGSVDHDLWSAFRALDIPPDRMTMHGFRAMARTILDEVLGFRPDFIEHQLAHAVRDPNGRAYNRTAFLPERRVMMVGHPA